MFVWSNYYENASYDFLKFRRIINSDHLNEIEVTVLRIDQERIWCFSLWQPQISQIFNEPTETDRTWVRNFNSSN